MKKIVKKILAAGVVLGTGIVVSKGRDHWGSRASRSVEPFDGNNPFGDNPAYELGRNYDGNLIFADSNRALRTFREDYRASWEPLQKQYNLPLLKVDSVPLYAAYLYQLQPHDPVLARFLQTFLNSLPKQ